MAFFGVNFILQKFCPCKKNDKYKVWSLTTKIQLADFEAAVDITTVARCNLVINSSLFTNQLLLIELLLLLINVCCVTSFYLLTAKTGRLWGCCCPCQLQLEGKQVSKTVKEKQQRRRFVNENITTQPNSCLWRAGIVVYEKSSTKPIMILPIKLMMKRMSDRQA